MNKLIRLALVALCFGAGALYSMPAVADGVTVSSSEGAITVTVAADTVAESTPVYLVWDTEDKGDTFADWTNKEELGDVTAAGDTFEVQGATHLIPDGAKIRAFVRGTSDEVEYLAATENSWVDTGIIGQYGDVYEIDFMMLDGTGNNVFVVGSCDNTSTGRFAPLHYYNGGFQQDVNDATGTLGLSADGRSNPGAAVGGLVSFPLGKRYRAVSTLTSGARKLSIEEVGGTLSVESTTWNYTTAIANKKYSLYLFTRNQTGSVNTANAARCRIYGFKVTRGGDVIQDLVPTATGFYDKVTKDMLDGSTTLTAGPAVDSTVAVSSAATYSAGGEEPPTPPTVVTVTPNANQSKTVGAADPTLTYTLSPEIAVTGALARATGEEVGTYAINLGTLGAADPSAYTLVLAATPVYFAITNSVTPPTPPTPTGDVEISSANGTITVTVPANAVEETAAVYLVWDTEDKDDDFADWTNNAKIGDVDAAGYTFEVQGATHSIPNGAAIRVFVMPGAIGLYESLTKAENAVAYVNTGYKPNTKTKKLALEFRYTDDGEASGNGWPMGASYKNNNTTVEKTGFSRDGSQPAKVYTYWGASANSLINGGPCLVRSTLTMTLGEKAIWGNVLATSPMAAAYTCDFPCPLIVFGRGDYEASTGVLTPVPFNRGDMTVYSLQIYATNVSTKVADYVPAEKDGAFGLYEKLSGAFYPAEGDDAATGFSVGEKTGVVAPPGTAIPSAAAVYEGEAEPEPPPVGEGIAVASAAGAITVTVDAGTVASPSDLILAWDTEDCGMTLGDWAHSARIATGVTAEGAVVNVTGLSLGITAGMKVRAFLGGESVQFYESLTKPKAVAAAVMTDYRPVFGQMTGYDFTVQLGDAFTSGTSFFFGIRAFASGSETARLILNCASAGDQACYASTYPESTSAGRCDKFSFANTGNFTKKGTFRIRPNTSTWSGDSWSATVTKPADTFAPASFDANLAVFGYTKVDGSTVTLDPFTCRDLTVFGLKIYEGSAVAAEYVPAEKNGEYGLFNVSNGNFCPASAAGLQPGERTVMHIPTVIGLTESADYVPGGDDPLAPMTASVAGGAWLADGQPHAATLTVTVPATGRTAKWAWHGEDAFTHDDPQACTAAGVYTNRVQVTADNFETFTGTAVVTLVDPAAGIAPMTRTRYLEAMNRIVSLYTDDILASILATARSKGVTEHGFPRLTSDLGVLIANGYQTSRRDAFVEMMDICCRDVPTKSGIANNFSVSELVFCLRQIEHANIVTTKKFAEWKSALSGSIAYDSLNCLGKADGNNWIVYATASEQARAGFGMNGSTANVEIWAMDQMRFFIDGEWNDDGDYWILYDLVTRLQYASALYHGYDGASAAQLIANLEAGADSFLEMQAATGEMAAGGRSQSYVMNEGIMAALAEWYAQHYAAKGDMTRAMRFRGAAVRAMEAMEGYLSRDIISHTKNNYPITSFSGTSKGCESYGYFDKYMTTAASWLCLAIDFLDAVQQPAVALEPLPEPTVHVMPAGFHQTMVTAGGYTAQFDSNANSQYDVKGLVRIVRRGVPSPMALMFGLPKSPNYSIDLTNPSNLAVVPMYWNGTGWKGYVDSTGATATYTLAEQSATDDSATVVWNVTHTSYPAVRMTVTVSAGGVSVKVENTDGTSRVGLRMPVFAFDGANDMTISATGTQVATTDADGNAATWRVESANGSVESADQVFANRNGHYNLYNACANDAEPLTVRVMLTQPGEKPPEPVIKRGLILFGSPAEK